MDWRKLTYETSINQSINFYTLYNNYKNLLRTHNELSKHMVEITNSLNNWQPQYDYTTITAPAVPVIEEESPEPSSPPPPPPQEPAPELEDYPYDDGLTDSDDDMYINYEPHPESKQDICAELLNIIDSKKETMENQTYIDLLNKLTQIHNS